jgi:prepilin-type N-terminal cleavage/methylation domain-containing protein/prepilin-type processing-associated H-X9-DG protein
MMAGHADTFKRRHSRLRGGAPGADRTGFTLIELLVVIAIIALLMAVLIPVLQSARRQAKAIVCQSRLRQWGMALAAYTEDHGGRFPTEGHGLWLLRGAYLSGKDANEPQNSFHHFHTRDIAYCPMATRPPANVDPMTGRTTAYSFAQGQGRHGSAFAAWELTIPTPVFQGSYGFNDWLFFGFSVNRSLNSDRRASYPDLLSLRGRPAIPVLLDAKFAWCSARPTEEGPPPSPDGPYGPGMNSVCMSRHGGSVNGLFLDWSVRPVGLKELWTLKWYRQCDTAGRWTKAGGVKPEDWPRWMRRVKDY